MDENHQNDPTTNMSIDQKITPNTQTVPPTFDISQPVVPGHDMVINHLDGAQELGTGNEANAVVAAEAEQGQHVALSDVQPQPEETVHRSTPDPETNQPNPAVATPSQLPEVGDERVNEASVETPDQPAEEPEVPTVPDVPEEDAAEAPKEDSEVPSEPTSADVADVL